MKKYTKVPSELNNPIDNIFVNIGEYLSPFFKKLNFTPNILTTISFASGLLSSYFYIKNKYLFSGIFILLDVFFDDFDGYYARKYDMVTKFGDWYDHITDLIVFILILFLIFKKYNIINDWKYYLPYVAIILVITLSIHLGCADKYYDKNESQSLHLLTKICPAKDKKNIYGVMKYLKLGGVGSLAVYTFFLIIYSKFINKKS